MERGYRYQPAERDKRKHRGTGDSATFDTDETGALIGRCPKTMTVDRAQQLLNDGIYYFGARRGRKHPRHIYVVDHDGTLYRTNWTIPGQSVHGFPEHMRRFPGGSEAAHVKAELLEQARAKDCEAELRAWMGWYE